MEIELIILIIVTSLNFLSSLLLILMKGAFEFMRRIEKSTCLGGSMELTKINDIKSDLRVVESKHDLLDRKTEQIINMLGAISQRREVSREEVVNPFGQLSDPIPIQHNNSQNTLWSRP